MPKASPIQTDFSGGQFSPLVQGRVDTQRYKTGLAKLFNYLPTIQGPIIRRPGTKFCAMVKDLTKPPRLVKFEFSVTQAYILEIGDTYIRFYADNGQIVASQNLFSMTGHYRFLNEPDTPTPTILSFYTLRTSSTPNIGEHVVTTTSVSSGDILELVSPYSYTDVFQLKFTQSADTLYIVHPDYPPHKLQRFSNDTWTLTEIDFKDGPYLENNSYATTSDSLKIALTPTAATGLVDLSTGPGLSISACANNGSGLIRVTSAAHGLSTGQIICINSVVGTVEANTVNYGITHGAHFWIVTSIDANNIDLQGSTFTTSYVSGGTIFPFLWNTTDAGRLVRLQEGVTWGWGKISVVTSGFQVSLAVNQTLTNTNAKSIWKLGSWTDVLGYPGCVCFHQDRLCFSGAPNFPQRIDMSASGDYENYIPNSLLDSSVADDNALSFNLTSNEVNAIRWLASDEKGLLSGALTSEWNIRSSSVSDALTPTNINAVQSSFYGSGDFQPVQSGKSTLYIQRSGRKIRELNYFFQVDGFRSTDLTELADLLTLPQVTMLAAQTETQPVIWGIKSDGSLMSTTYQRDDVSLKSGCAAHELGGQSDSSGTPPIIQSIAVIPSPDQTFDQLWMTVQRWLNGQKVITVEFMTKFFDDSFKQEDAFFADCGATFDNPLTISGITTASPLVITSIAHGLSNGDKVKLVDIVGISSVSVDRFGTKTITSLLNGGIFLVANKTTDTFQLTDFSGNAINSTGLADYVSGGTIRKLVTTISGLTWLENETVSVLADGAQQPDCVVSNSGAITLSYPAAKVQIGFKYNSDGQLLRNEAGSATGSSIGKTRRVHRFAMLVHQMLGLLYGISFDNLFPFINRQGDVNQMDQAPSLYSGIITDTVAAQYDTENQICWRQNDMLPGMISSITPMLEEFDR